MNLLNNTKMKLYIYKIETNEIVAVVNGNTNSECEAKAEKLTTKYNLDRYEWSYTPGNVLWETNETKEI